MNKAERDAKLKESFAKLRFSVVTPTFIDVDTGNEVVSVPFSECILSENNGVIVLYYNGFDNGKFTYIIPLGKLSKDGCYDNG